MLNLPILIADDSEINRILLSVQLEHWPCTVEFAEDGREALQLLNHRRYSLIFLDINMPFLTGLELVKILKTQPSLNCNTPIVAITAASQHHPEQWQNFMNAGFDDCLIKPIVFDSVQKIMQHWHPGVAPNFSPQQLKKLTASDATSFARQIFDRTAHNKPLACLLLSQLCKELSEQIAEVEQALASLNYPQAIKIAHLLHGSFSFCGFTELQQVAAHLEASLVAADNYAANLIFPALKHATQNLLELENPMLEAIESM